jgi:hypothetical protein
MALDVSLLDKATSTEVRVNGELMARIWYGEANGTRVKWMTKDIDSEFWVSPILNMRQKGVALVDHSGQMVTNERRDR